MLMLATVRIGAIHSVVFAGFGEHALADRIQASGSRLVFTADITYRRGKDVPLKGIVDEALASVGDCVEHVVVAQARRGDVPMQAGRDLTWDDFLARGDGQSGAYVPMESNEPAFILATSGTTAKPKLAVHTHGGYQVHIHAMARWCYGLTPDDVWWSTSDIGWIVGHSYIVYAPLITGCTTLAFEGALDYPAPEANWRAAVEELGVTGIFTSPTAVRLLMRYGDEPLAHGRSLAPRARLLRWRGAQRARLGVAAEHGAGATGSRSSTTCGRPRPAGPIFGNPYGLGMLPIKPGSASIPLPGIEAAVMTPEGELVRAQREGHHGASSGRSPG